jgi:ABC-type uncharacterized transport system auxiliary subunit
MPQRQIVALHTVEYFEPAAADTVEAVVEAFDEALGKCFRRIVEWALTAVPQHRPSTAFRDEIPK